MLGFTKYHRALLERLATETKGSILSIDTVVSAYWWLIEEGIEQENIIIGEDSAGLRFGCGKRA